MRPEQAIPYYPKTPHLPHNPNVQDDDAVASEEETSFLFESPTLIVEEKVDGANSGIMFDGENVVVRNREHVLNKGYQKKETPAKLQFRPIWNWAYDNRKCFELLFKHFGEPVAVYGEWMWAQHSIPYDRLPSYFIAFEFHYPGDLRLTPLERRGILTDCGFSVAPLLHKGPIKGWSDLDALVSGPSAFSSTQLREGVVVKDTGKLYKMLRPGFVRAAKWERDTPLVRNKLA